MTIDEAIEELRGRILSVESGAVLRVQRRSDEEAIIRAYVPVEKESAIQEAVRDRTIELLTNEGLDIQVLIYDKETSLPPGE